MQELFLAYLHEAYLRIFSSGKRFFFSATFFPYAEDLPALQGLLSQQLFACLKKDQLLAASQSLCAKFQCNHFPHILLGQRCTSFRPKPTSCPLQPGLVHIAGSWDASAVHTCMMYSHTEQTPSKSKVHPICNAFSAFWKVGAGWMLWRRW